MIPCIGRIVHYRLDKGPNAGSLRPAMITRVMDANPTEASAFNCQVMTDGENDGLANVEWRTSVKFGFNNGDAVAPHAAR